MTDILINKTQEVDVDIILSMESNIENSQFIFPNSKKEHISLIKDENIEHLILKSKKNEIIGFVILAGLKDKNRNIEFRRIVIKEKGKGFGRIAIKKLKEYSFEKLNCHRFWLDVLKTNERAKYLYLSEGFKIEGELRDCILVRNKYEDLIIMSILENEYKNTTANTVYKK